MRSNINIDGNNMIKFIELHNYEDNRPISINIDQIVSFYPNNENNYSFIKVNQEDEWYTIKESYSTIKKILNNFYNIIKKEEDCVKFSDILKSYKKEEDFAFIEGSGDLLYCGNCHGDIAPAYVEHIHTCPHCGINLKDKNEYQ